MEDVPEVRVASLYVTQNKLRSILSLREYIEFVKQGGVFNSESKIVVVAFEDGNYYVFDGHHRYLH